MVEEEKEENCNFFTSTLCSPKQFNIWEEILLKRGVNPKESKTLQRGMFA